MVRRCTNCNDCTEALFAQKKDLLSSKYAFISFKSNGGLIYPSPSVVRICEVVERCFRLVEARGLHLTTETAFLSKHVTLPTLKDLLLEGT